MTDARDSSFPHAAPDEARRLELFRPRLHHPLALRARRAGGARDRAGTPLAVFYRLSMAALGPPAVAAGALSVEQAAALVERPEQPDFLGCGFVHIGVRGRRPHEA